MSDFGTRLEARLGPGRVRRDVPLREYTTFKAGGPADWFVEPRNAEEMLAVIEVARACGERIVLLGGGSNVLVSDAGVRGVVVRPRGGDVRQVDAHHIRADASMTINGLVRWTISHGLAGLEAWAGTPGTVGGAVFGNAHFGGRLISELISSVRLASTDGVVRDVPVVEMGFGYDQSRLQRSGEVLLSADFIVEPGEPVRLREVARQSLAYRKRTQPLDVPSAGCIFQNPVPGQDVVPDGIPWSAGALVDRAGLKGAAVGGARVSSVHGNFIVNERGATATEIRQLIERCREQVRQQFGVHLREEIVYLGEFDQSSVD